MDKEERTGTWPSFAARVRQALQDQEASTQTGE